MTSRMSVVGRGSVGSRVCVDAISAGAPMIRRRFESSAGGYGMRGLALRRVMIDRIVSNGLAFGCIG